MASDTQEASPAISGCDRTTLLVEPFYGGSHRQLIDLLQREISGCDMYTLPAKKWHWRARTSALYFSQVIPRDNKYRVLFCSSVLNLAELVALRPDLAALRKVVYFHENQLVYPVRKQQDRDFQYGYNQILTSLVADVVVFNSSYNQESFLSGIQSFLKLIPDHRPRNLDHVIQPKCRVVYFPVEFPRQIPTLRDTQATLIPSREAPDSTQTVIRDTVPSGSDPVPENLAAPGSERVDYDAIDSGIESSTSSRPLVIAWAHRWEHDKNPELFFEMMYALMEEGLDFRLAVMGETFTDVPAIFVEARSRLESRVVCWGYQADRSAYYQVLRSCDVSVSTARHEFFGVTMLESVSLGCYPLVPNDLVYPEIFPRECLYNTKTQLLKRLRQFCQKPYLLRSKTLKMELDRFSWERLCPAYRSLLSTDNSLTPDTATDNTSTQETTDCAVASTSRSQHTQGRVS